MLPSSSSIAALESYPAEPMLRRQARGKRRYCRRACKNHGGNAVLGTGQTSARERSSQNAQRPSFTILRKEGEAMREIVADEMTLVAPDDVIKIPTVRR
jgi:hypothetical protein